MNTWIIEPRDPLVVRDGRPFGTTPGARAVSLDFPFPSTITGGVRSRDGLNANGVFDVNQRQRVKGIEVRGPLLVELDAQSGEIKEWCVPAPSDALLLDLEPRKPDRAQIKQLVPLDTPPDSVNLPDKELSLVGMTKIDPRKPLAKPPCFWRWTQFKKWLTNPHDQEIALSELGHSGPPMDSRTHVSIQKETQTAIEGALFQTRGLEFSLSKNPGSDRRFGSNEIFRLGLAVSSDAPELKKGLAPLAGERRLVMWRKSSQNPPPCPDDVKNKIAETKHCRLFLLTPACFKKGWKPEWLLGEREGVIASVKAMALPRHCVVSGWDFEINRPKHTRRLAPAGTVMFLELKGEDSAIHKWIDAIWMHCVSDTEQDRLDGFGLAALGIWDGKLKQMEVRK